jgi:hypothetical protein
LPQSPTLRGVERLGPISVGLLAVQGSRVVKWVGEGPELFSARVDLTAPDDDARWVRLVAASLMQRLPFSNGTGRALIGVDQGRGHEDAPVVGLTFLLRATDFAGAARLAVETAVAAGADAGLTGKVYDVVLVPEDALVLPEEERRIPMPD